MSDRPRFSHSGTGEVVRIHSQSAFGVLHAMSHHQWAAVLAKVKQVPKRRRDPVFTEPVQRIRAHFFTRSGLD
jgi:hypothetical protein